MVITRIAHTYGISVGGGDATTVGINTTGADFLVAIVNGFDAAAVWASGDLTDNRFNTWTMRTATASGVCNLQVWDCVPTSVGADHYFTISAANVGYPTICVAAYSGVRQASRFDQQVRNASGTGTTVQAGSMTPTESAELILFAAGMQDPVGTISVDSGFTVLEDHPFSGGQAMGAALAEKIKVNATAENPTFTYTTSQGNFLATTISYRLSPPADNFTRADSTGLGANWTVITNRFDVVTNKAVTQFSGNNVAAWNADSFGNDQYSQSVATNNITNGPIVRCSLVAATYYAFACSPGSSAIQKSVAGVGSNLLTGLPGIANGDTLKLTAVGTTLEAFINGVSVGSVTDASIASGYAGISANGSANQVDSFIAETIGGGGGGSNWGPMLAGQLNRLIQGN